MLRLQAHTTAHHWWSFPLLTTVWWVIISSFQREQIAEGVLGGTSVPEEDVAFPSSAWFDMGWVATRCQALSTGLEPLLSSESSLFRNCTSSPSGFFPPNPSCFLFSSCPSSLSRVEGEGLGSQLPHPSLQRALSPWTSIHPCPWSLLQPSPTSRPTGQPVS